MLELLVASAAILVAATIVAAQLTARGTVAFLLAVALLAHGMVVATVGIAGLVLRSLSPAVLLALALGWLAAAGVLAAARRGTPVRWRERSARSLVAIRSTLANPAVALAALLVLGTLAWRTVLAFRLPIVDYDGWSYHMVIVDVWFQHGALTLVPQRPWTAGYPSAQELMTTWLVAFTGNDSLASLTSLVPIPAAIAATAGLARSFGATRPWALLAGLVFGMTPALVVLAGTSYVDAASIGTVTATWWLGLRMLRGERDVSAALLLGIAGGLATGIKGTNLLLVVPMLTAVGLVLLRDLWARRAAGAVARTVLAQLAVLVLPVLVLGGSWYLKNLLVHGNPLYPFALGPLPGATTLTDFAFVPRELEGKGLIGQLLTSWTADWHLQRYIYNVRPGGLGRAWPLILALGVGGGVLLAWRRRFVPLALVVLPAAVTLAVMPMPWYARYTLFLVAISMPLAAVLLSAVPARVATAGSLVLVAVAAISLVFANIHPNIDLRPERAHASARQYLAFVLSADSARRSNVSLRAQCAGFGVIPAGARVAPGGFNLLHGVVGPDLDRVLTDPIAAAHDPGSLAAAVRDQGATWLVTSDGGANDDLAASAPDLFIPHGDICQGGRLWQLASAAP